MMRRFLSILCFAALLAAGCSVYEVPVGGDDFPEVALTLSVGLENNIGQHSTVDYTKAAGSSQANGRFILRFFPLTGEGNSFLTATPYEFSFTEQQFADGSFTVAVPPLDYHLEVWADRQDGTNSFYDASNFSEIGVNKDSYAGGSELRDAFCGSIDIKLSSHLENRSTDNASVSLKRPVAKFSFVSTDKAEFLKYWGENADLSKFRVRVSYPQFMPSAYNLHKGESTDSATGVYFDTNLSELEDGNIELGWDWVFATDDKSSVVVSMEVFDPSGTSICNVSNILLPLAPGKKTTLLGKLLTSGAQGGITIDPGFEDDIVIVIS